MFEEISAEEAIERGTRPGELIYMLHRVCEDTTVSELSSSVGFVRIVPEEVVAPDDEPKKPMMSFAEMLGEESSPVEDAELNEPVPPPLSEEREETESFRLGKDPGATQSRLESCKDRG